MKLTSKEKLIIFIKLKNSRIKKITDIDYITNEDIKDIESWDIELCDKVYKKLEININNIRNHNFSGLTCPWCIIYYEIDNDYDDINGYCDPDCGYLIRHGNCFIENSLYQTINFKNITNALTRDFYCNIIKKMEKGEYDETSN